MKIARISKVIFGKSQCNTEMSTVIPNNLKRVALHKVKMNANQSQDLSIPLRDTPPPKRN